MYGHKKATVNDGVQDDRGMITPGATFYVEGKVSEVFGASWQTYQYSNWAAKHYATRVKMFGLPMDDDVYYGKIDSLGHILHRSEFTYGE